MAWFSKTAAASGRGWRRSPAGLLYAACFAPFDQAWLCWIALTPLLAAVWFSGENRNAAGCAICRSVTSRAWRFSGPSFPGSEPSLFPAWSWSEFTWRSISRSGAGSAVCCGPACESAAERGGVDAITVAQPKYAASAHPDAVAAALSRRAARARRLDSEATTALAFRTSDSEPIALAAARQTIFASLSSSPPPGSRRNGCAASVFSGWGWNTLGTALHGQLALIQIAEFTGVAGLSFLVAFTNVILLATVAPVHPRNAGPADAAALRFDPDHGGDRRRDGIRPPLSSDPAASARLLNVALVQPNIPREEKFSVGVRAENFRPIHPPECARLSTPVRVPILLVWPESSMPGPVLSDERATASSWIFRRRPKPICCSAHRSGSEPNAYNAALLVSDGGAAHAALSQGPSRAVRRICSRAGTRFPLLARVVGDQVPADFAFGKEHTVFHLTNDKAQGRAADLLRGHHRRTDPAVRPAPAPTCSST